MNRPLAVILATMLVLVAASVAWTTPFPTKSSLEYTSEPLPIAQGSHWTINHISSALHVANVFFHNALAVRCVNTGGTAYESCAGTGGSSHVAVDVVNVFHQSTIRHISSITHVVIVDWPRHAHLAAAQSGFWNITAHQGGSWTMSATQSGAWNVSAAQSGAFTVQAAHQGGQWNIAHISSIAHIAGGVFLQSRSGTVVTVTGTALDVNCTGCAAASVVNVGHIASALHIAGTINGAQFHIQGLGIPGAAHGGVLTVQGVTGMIPFNVTCSNCSGGSDAVNVFHQSTVRHISSLTHVVIVDWQRWAHIATAQSGSWTIQAAHQGGQWTIAHISSVTHVAGYGTFLVNFHTSASATVSQSGVWSMTAHQGGEWNVRHVSGALHIAGSINGAQIHVQGLGIPGAAHGGVLTVQGVAGMVALSVTCTNCTGGGDAVNVFHQSTIRHISSVTHVAGYGTFLVNFHSSATAAVSQFGTWTIQAAHQGGEWNVRHVSTVLHVAGYGTFLVNMHGSASMSVAQSGVWNVTAHQGGNWNVGHVSSSVHIAVALKPGSNHQMVEMTGPHLTGAVHVSGISNIGSGNVGTGTTAITCHSTIALHVTGTGFATAGGSAFGGSRSIAVLHLTSSNGGVNQSTWRFYICSISIWSNVGMGNTVNITGGPTGTNVGRHMASSFSIIEGSGTDCATNPRPLIGSLGTEGIPMVNYHAGATVNMVSPFPFMSTQVGGNSLCIIHGMKGSQYITGTMSYRASP